MEDVELAREEEELVRDETRLSVAVEVVESVRCDDSELEESIDCRAGGWLEEDDSSSGLVC